MRSKTQIKITKKLEQERIQFNKTYRKGQPALTMEQYVNYITGKGLPSPLSKQPRKALKAMSLPTWAVTTHNIPSVPPSDHVAVKVDASYKHEVSKKFTVSIPYNKGGYQVLIDSEIKNAGQKV